VFNAVEWGDGMEVILVCVFEFRHGTHDNAGTTSGGTSMFWLFNAVMTTGLFAFSAMASDKVQPHVEEITVEAGSNHANSRSQADRQARQRAERSAREACRQEGGRPAGVTSERISIERASATKYYATWSSTVSCEFRA
jgi:hypothetical protein